MSVATPRRTAAAQRLAPAGKGLRLLLLGLGALDPPFLCHVEAKNPRLSNVFQTGMVLQRGRPIEVWGYDAVYGETLDVMLDLDGGDEVSWTEAVAGLGGHWRATLTKPPASVTGAKLKLSVTRRGAQHPAQVLDDVVLGDVYLFSGQSNVDLPVSYVHQFDEAAMEAEERFADDIGGKGLLRLMIVPARCGLTYQDSLLSSELADVKECKPCPPPFAGDPASSDINSCNLLGGHSRNYSYCNCDSLRWTRSTGKNVRGFSAVAWFFGKALLAIEAAKGVPVGLVRSSWGATNIAVWSGIDALAKCPQEGDPPTSFAPYVKSALWGHMIYPLKGLHMSAAVWVHGARNIGGADPYMGGKYYSCALRAMITDWRDKLGLASLPFLIVESPVYCNELDYRTWHTWCDDTESQLRFPDEHLPEMRLAQNEAEALPHVYIVSTMDQGSLKKAMGGAIHSEKKPELGRRLALAAQAAVYKDPHVVWSGPTATRAWQSGPREVSVCFDTRNGGRLVLNETATCPAVVLPVYCTGATFELMAKGVWNSPSSVSVSEDGSTVVISVLPEVGRVERVRYAWADWPVCSILNKAGMPARLFNLPVHNETLDEMPGCRPVSGEAATTAAPNGRSVRGTNSSSGWPELVFYKLRNPDPQVMRIISMISTALICFPLFGIAAIAVRWGIMDTPFGKGCEEIPEPSTTDQSSELGDFKALDMPGSGSSTAATSGGSGKVPQKTPRSSALVRDQRITPRSQRTVRQAEEAPLMGSNDPKEPTKSRFRVMGVLLNKKTGSP
mmetsp:Transcript_36645/g.101787  ORF Transcript_36645/g.101787 Transcript_36645/m.101787 type:complete len:785 (-) Transcript_36645:136-2490(-)